MVTNDFWKNRWLNHETPWHQNDVEDLLKRFCPHRVFQKCLVPLCGKSRDLLWLKQKSDSLVGIELSAIACEEFFHEAGFEVTKTEYPHFLEYSGGGISLLCGDFFEIPLSEFQGVDYIYDRAALIALPEDLRKRYAAKLTQIISASTSQQVEMLLIGRQDGSLGEGPPFEVTEQEVRRLYSSPLSVEVLGRQERPSRADADRFVTETAYRVSN